MRLKQTGRVENQDKLEISQEAEEKGREKQGRSPQKDETEADTG